MVPNDKTLEIVKKKKDNSQFLLESCSYKNKDSPQIYELWIGFESLLELFWLSLPQKLILTTTNLRTVRCVNVRCIGRLEELSGNMEFLI